MLLVVLLGLPLAVVMAALWFLMRVPAPRLPAKTAKFWSQIIETSAQQHVELIVDLVRNAQFSYRADLAALVPTGNPDQDESLGDDAHLLDELRKLSLQGAVVAAYVMVELDTKRIMRHCWDPETIRRHYQFNRLKKFLKKELAIRLAGLPDYNEVRELLAVNNAIKHAGMVTPELARFRGWNEGDELANLDVFLQRTLPALPRYLGSIADSIITTP
ncbi:MAG: hypothetical protein WC700_04525 [Gemmatimonadaceae bacterium]|jgi:hypothetical protein